MPGTHSWPYSPTLSSVPSTFPISSNTQARRSSVFYFLNTPSTPTTRGPLAFIHTIHYSDRDHTRSSTKAHYYTSSYSHKFAAVQAFTSPACTSFPHSIYSEPVPFPAPVPFSTFTKTYLQHLFLQLIYPLFD